MHHEDEYLFHHIQCSWISEYNLLTCVCVAWGVIVQREIHDWIKTAFSITENTPCIWSVTALPLVDWLPYRRGLSARQRHQSAIYHPHWSMEWTTGYTIALFPVLLCMELCVHGGEDWLFLDKLCLQHAPHITMTSKYPLLAKSCDPWCSSIGDMEPLHYVQTICVY